MSLNRMLLIVLVAAGLIGLWKWMDTPDQPAIQSTHNSPEQEDRSAHGSPAAANSPASSASTEGAATRAAESAPEARPTASLARAIPSLDAYLKDISRDPHAIPEVVQRFTHEITLRMASGMKDQEKARALIPELAKCSERAAVPTVRFQCLVNAKRLGQRWPDLARDSDAVLDAAKPEDRARLEQLGI